MFVIMNILWLATDCAEHLRHITQPPPSRETSGRLRGKGLEILTNAAIEAAEDTPPLIPDGFRISKEDRDKVEERAAKIAKGEFGSGAWIDPDGALIPGRLYSAPKDLAARRLLATLHTTDRGKIIAGVCIEGMPGVYNTPLSALQQKLSSGELVQIPPPEIER